ncbi:MAG: hypothetical protein NVSMB6_23750 [Burkholderiaceae bacterium]
MKPTHAAVPDTILEEFFARLTIGCDPREMKIEVAAFALQCLEVHEKNLCPQRKLHFVNAIGTLSLRRGSGNRITVAELRVALLDLGKAIAPQMPEQAFTALPKSVSNLIDYAMLQHAATTCVQRGPSPVPLEPQVHLREQNPVMARSHSSKQTHQAPPSLGYRPSRRPRVPGCGIINSFRAAQREMT